MITHSLKVFTPRALLIGVAVAALTACATAQPNQGIVDAQARLSSAYNDKLTAERGQGDLASAKSALRLAEDDWSHGEKDKTNHQLTMATTFLDLAETRGRQAGVEQDTVRLTNEAQLASKNRQIAGRDRQIAERDQQIASQGQQLSSQDQQLASKDRQLADAREQLRDYDMKTTELGSTMVLQDVSFESGKSDLLAGGTNRLQPLINYLRLSPTTRVRIEGYTDNVGGADFNQKLSLDRANSVKATLTAGSIDGGRIETIGSGLEKPVATNKTVSGRQSNRRVEITLLKQPGV
jgi:outer membrane protein OmpA-like peptidoglycan-associated protein